MVSDPNLDLAYDLLLTELLPVLVPVVQQTTWEHCIAMTSPAFCQNSRFQQIVKQLHVKQLITKISIE